MCLPSEKQEIIEIYKAWSQRALKECMQLHPGDEIVWRHFEDCLNMIVEEIAVISEERVRSEIGQTRAYRS